MTKDNIHEFKHIMLMRFFEISEKKLDETVFIRKDFPGNIFINFEIIYGKSCISLHIPWDENSL